MSVVQRTFHAATLLAVVFVGHVAGAQVAVVPAGGGDRSISVAQRRAVVDSVTAYVERTYVDADTAKRIAAHLRSRRAAGAYDAAITVDALGGILTNDLRSINNDLHLGVRSEGPLADRLDRPAVAHAAAGPEDGPGQEPPVARSRVPGGYSEAPGDLDTAMLNDPRYQQARRANFGIGKIEILPGNVGYLEITGFLGAPGAEHAVEDALRVLERTDALIIDVRRNGGGSGMMSHLVASHFLSATPRPTIRVAGRQQAPFTMHSFANVPGPRRVDVPLYILTSRATGSAAEEFSFVLRNAQRATLVGDRTAGAGHMVQAYNAGHGFVVSISITRVSDPVTGKEWEQVGVEPHVKVAPERALDVSHALALQAVAKVPSLPADRAAELERLATVSEARAKGLEIDMTRAALWVGEYEGDRALRLLDGRLQYRSSRRPVWEALVCVSNDRFMTPNATQIRFEGDGASRRIVIQRANSAAVTAAWRAPLASQ